MIHHVIGVYMLSEPNFIAKSIVITFPQKGDVISFKNDNLIVKNNENKIKVQMSCYRLFALYIVGGFTITTGIIEKSKRFGFSIVMFTSGFKFYSAINYCMEGNTLLRAKQYTTNKVNEIAKAIIINKIENQRNALIKTRKVEYIDAIKILNGKIEKLKDSKMDNFEIMGIEGICSKVYFKRLFDNAEWNR